MVLAAQSILDTTYEIVIMMDNMKDYEAENSTGSMPNNRM
jgi:hypothetical protein